MGNYVSPYGFGPVTDAVIDCIADRRGMTTGEMEAAIGLIRDSSEDDGFSLWAENEWWRDYMGPAVDKLEDRMSEFLPEVPD